MSSIMTEKKVRILFFTLGIAVGIILGASVVKVYSDKVNAETSVSKNFVSRLFGNIIGLVYKPKPSKSDSLTPKNTRIFNSTRGVFDSTKAMDESKVGNNSNDNLIKDSIEETNKPEKTEENIVVLSDKLIYTSRIQIIENKTNEPNKKDSLLGISGGKKLSKHASIYAVEFWTSPLNSRGYKTQKNKIVLYGISKDEPLKLVRLNDRLFLKFQNQYSLIENHNDLHGFEKVFDQQLITQLNLMQ